MATWNDVERIMTSLPAVEVEADRRRWKVKAKAIAWERPLRQRDLDELGAGAPKGAILGVHVPLAMKEMLLDSAPRIYFTTSHFNGYPAILVRLGAIRAPALRTLLEAAWRERAPKKLLSALSET